MLTSSQMNHVDFFFFFPIASSFSLLMLQTYTDIHTMGQCWCFSGWRVSIVFVRTGFIASHVLKFLLKDYTSGTVVFILQHWYNADLFLLRSWGLTFAYISQPSSDTVQLDLQKKTTRKLFKQKRCFFFTYLSLSGCFS